MGEIIDIAAADSAGSLFIFPSLTDGLRRSIAQKAKKP